MGVVNNQCAYCGRWRSRRHSCPTPQPSKPLALDGKTLPEFPPPAPGVPARIDRARTYLAELRNEKDLYYPPASHRLPPRATYTYSEMAMIGALSRDCDMHPDTPWRPQERERMEQLFRAQLKPDCPQFAGEQAFSDGTVLSDTVAIDYVLARADSDPVLRDRFRLAFGTATDPEFNLPPNYSIQDAVLITSMHDEAAADTQFAEARDMAVAYTAATHGGYPDDHAYSVISEMFHNTCRRAGHDSPIAESIVACFFGPNSG